jgi:predicted DNA-binding transcriptional regulator AlpA
MSKIACNPGSHHVDRRASDLIAQGTGDPDDLLSTSDLAEWTGLSVQFFEIGRHRGYGPSYIRLSPRRIRYKRADVLAWLTARTHHRTSEYA